MPSIQSKLSNAQDCSHKIAWAGMAISDEELSCISGDEFKYNIMNQAKSKCESSCESEAYGRDSDTSSDSGSVEVEELPFVINEIITKYGLEYVKNSLLSEISDYVKAKITTEHLEEAFYVVDLGPVFRRWGTWMRLMPRVKPHYAVKCNPSPVILALLAALGTGFDCASSRELDLVASLGVDVSKRVIFANPCKLPGHIRYARQLGIPSFHVASLCINYSLMHQVGSGPFQVVT